MNKTEESKEKETLEKIQSHIDIISESRLLPYIPLIHNWLPNKSTELETKVLAVCIYTVLQARSCLFFAHIQEIEIAIRNTICSLIIKYLAPNQDIIAYLCQLAFDKKSNVTPQTKEQLRRSIINLLRTQKLSSANQAHQALLSTKKKDGDLIAAITFGVWINFFNQHKTNPYKDYWKDFFTQHNIFNNRFKTINEIFSDLNRALDFRNRLYHQDKIWEKRSSTPIEALNSLKKRYDMIDTTLEKVAPERYWIIKSSSIQDLLVRHSFDEQLFKNEIQELYQKFTGNTLYLPE